MPNTCSTCSLFCAYFGGYERKPRDEDGKERDGWCELTGEACGKEQRCEEHREKGDE